jgi:hypothetical protein
LQLVAVHADAGVDDCAARDRKGERASAAQPQRLLFVVRQRGELPAENAGAYAASVD